MVKPVLIEEVPITLVEAKVALDALQARDTTLNFRAGKCYEYLNDFAAGLAVEKAQELRKKLQGANVSRLREDHIVKIIDVLPQTPEDVRLLFQGGTVSLTKKDFADIAAIVQEFLK